MKMNNSLNLSLSILLQILLASGSNCQQLDQRLSYITLGVDDLERSVNFYENVFGWERHVSSTQAIIFFQLHGFRMALFPRNELAEDSNVVDEDNGFNGFTISYNVRSINAVDEIIANLAAKGAPILKPPTLTSWGGYSAAVNDPDGNIWEIAFNPFIKLDSAGLLNK